MRRWYRRSLKHFYIAGTLGFIVGLKMADWAFYRPEEYEDISEKMEEDYWKTWGEPTELKPELVESKVTPNTLRKSWIQVVYGKDNVVPKVPKTHHVQGKEKERTK